MQQYQIILILLQCVCSNFFFLTIKYTFETWFPRGPRVQQIFAENFMFIIWQHVFQEEHNKLTDKEKLKLIESKKSANYGLHRGITRSQRALKKEALVEEFDKKFSIDILEKTFHASRASFLREHKKYQKEGKLPNKGWKLYESMLFLKNEPKTSEKFYIYGITDKICCGKIAAFFAACEWKMLLVVSEL